MNKSEIVFFSSLLLCCLSIGFVTGCYYPGLAMAERTGRESEGAIPTAMPVHGDVKPVSTFLEAGEGSEDPILSEKKESGEQSALDAAMDLTEAAHEYLADGDIDKALEALDLAYGLITGADCGSDLALVRQKENLRYTISRTIVQVYAARFAGAGGDQLTIPFSMNKHVEREIELLKNEDRSFLREAYRRSGRFRGEIVRAFQEAGLPEELSWLPLVESGFKVNALSRARALGLWQFIPSTGYKFGLTRTDWIDERMDPQKSTIAAIAYLKELHAIFGDWATVLAAYHCGEGAVLRAIRRQKIDYLDNFWGLYERLPADSARYYPRFLAVLAIVKDPARYGIAFEEIDTPPVVEAVTVQKRLHLKTISEKLAVPFEELAELNPELRLSVTPASSYSLKVPAGKGPTLLAGLDSMSAWSIPKKRYVVHRVRRGENLSHLALRYRTSVGAIRQLNRLRRNGLLQVGQRLKIPVRGT
jgi:membrane-bound lytic murein transglycosylase D